MKSPRASAAPPPPSTKYTPTAPGAPLAPRWPPPDLWGFDAAQMRQTINLAASMSPANTWTPCFEGATVRNLYPGRSNLQGILAANLSQCGFTAIQDGPSDLYGSVLGSGFDSQKAVDGLGQKGSYRIQQNYFKFHACCWYNHPVLDAVQSLQRQNEIVAGQVEQVRVSAPAMAHDDDQPGARQHAVGQIFDSLRRGPRPGCGEYGRVCLPTRPGGRHRSAGAGPGKW